jgi:hypothetical protein
MLYYTAYRIDDLGSANTQFEMTNAASSGYAKIIILLKYKGCDISFPYAPTGTLPMWWPVEDNEDKDDKKD